MSTPAPDGVSVYQLIRKCYDRKIGNIACSGWNRRNNFEEMLHTLVSGKYILYVAEAKFEGNTYMNVSGYVSEDGQYKDITEFYKNGEWTGATWDTWASGFVKILEDLATRLVVVTVDDAQEILDQMQKVLCSHEKRDQTQGR